uniref:hypothetical protein n=1 Tax=Micromonospora sp. NBC_00855 TaxID=2975978 RepID=UPI002255BC51|nr:hypothetical protein OHB51_35305 [Micromonospora sp. NBC_00855]
MSSRTRTSIVATFIAVAAALAGPGPAGAQQPVNAIFTPASQNYEHKDQHGRFTAGVIYSAESGGTLSNRMFWKLQLTPYVQEMIVGDTMACSASIDGMRGWSDNHPAVPGDYMWHSTVTDIRLNTAYTLRMQCAFMANNGYTTAPGEVKFAVTFAMNS